MPESISAADACYALDIVRAICKQVGPGLPGSPEESARAAIIREELESHLGRTNVAVEEFGVAPWAMLSGPPLSALLLFSATLLNIATEGIPGAAPWVTAVPGLVFAILAPLPFILLFVRNQEWADRYLRQSRSVNVIGTLRPPSSDRAMRLHSRRHRSPVHLVRLRGGRTPGRAALCGEAP